MNDPRFSDASERIAASRLGSTVGLEGTPREGYRIIHEMDGTWTAQHRTARAVPTINQGEEWEELSAGHATADDALASVDHAISAAGMQPAE